MLSQTKNQYTSSIKGNIILCLLSLSIIFSLINSNIFLNKTLSAYYYYLICASITIVVLGATGLLNNKIYSNSKVRVTLPLVLFCIWLIYVTSIGLFNDNWNTRYTYLLVNVFLFISLHQYSNYLVLIFKKLSWIITLIALIESFICIGQYLGSIESSNSYIATTGSWGNPNVTAMFITMVFPTCIGLLFSEKKTLAKIAVTTIIAFLLFALAVLKCRTAFIGLLASSTIILNHELKLFQIFLKKSKSFKLITIMVLAVVLLSTTFYFYKSKQASSEGRQLIWKISWNIISKNLVSGNGYGMFERNYNLAQGEYFASGIGSDNEKRIASFVKMGYNEFLENTVEGGIIGVLIFSAILFIFLYKPYPDDNISIIAIAGIASFAVMSMVNFTIQAIPAMAMFIIYGAIRSYYQVFASTSQLFSTNLYLNSKFFFWALFLIGTYFLITQTRQIQAQLDVKKASKLVQHNKPKKAIKILEPNSEILGQSSGFWITYANALIQNQQYDEAIEKIAKAKKLTSNPELFQQEAFCYQKMKFYKKAKEAYTVASNIQPVLLAPNYGLMLLYLEQIDTTNALAQAKILVAKTPKVASAKADAFKNDAINIIKQYAVK